MAGAAALAIYLRTLAPGVVAVVDTPMFQFIGRALGVPHNPGYPLYVLLTHAFSYAPIGSLAYRINLFSALCGAAAVALVFLLCRQLGCRAVISLAAALGLAFGHIFWSQSIIAEVYTLNAATLAAALLLLLVWGRRQQSGVFFAAVAVFAAGLGNHTTILAFAPGMAGYALMTDRRFVLRPRTLSAVVAIVAAGLVQYGFIVLRSRQPDTYVESRATTLPELLRVMSGAQFEDRLFSFEWRTVLVERIPWVVHRVLATELTVPGLVLAAVGALWLLTRRLPEAVLLLPGCAAIVAFAANYNVVDTPVFLIPATLVLWLCAAIGMEWAVGRAGGRAARVASLAAVALPIWLVSSNFERTDRSHDTEAARQLDALFDALPDDSALVHEDFIVDRLVMFKLLGEGAARGRRIEAAAPRDAGALRTLRERGMNVFAFPRSARRLRYEGLGFAYAPLPVMRESFAELLAQLPAGAVVALAVPSRDRGLIAHAGFTFAAVGGPDGPPGLPTDHTAAVGVRGARDGAMIRADAAAAHLTVRAGERLEGMAFTAASDIDVSSGTAQAVIRHGKRDIVRTTEGAAVAIWTAEGRLEHAFVLERASGFAVPLKAGPLSVYPLRGPRPSQTIGPDAWTDVRQSVLTGSVMLRVASGTTVELLCGDRFPLAPRAIDRSSNAVTVDAASLDAADPGRRHGLAAARFAGLPHVYKVQITASTASGSVLLGFGGVCAAATARVTDPANGAAATAFSVDTLGLLRTPDRRSEVLLMARDDQAQLTGAGWSAVDTDAFTPYRWMTAAEGRLVLPVEKSDPRRIRIQVLCNQDVQGANVSLRLNDAELPAQPLRPGWHAYEWTVEAGTLQRGTNDAAIMVDRTPPERGIAVADLRLVHGQ